jgi:hypothetical protein
MKNIFAFNNIFQICEHTLLLEPEIFFNPIYKNGLIRMILHIEVAKHVETCRS